MSETTDKIKYLGMKGTKALLEGLKGEYSPLGHEHSWNELNDKPFYKDVSIENDVFLETATVPFNVMGSTFVDATGITLYTYNLSGFMRISPDGSYVITFDGVEYFLEPKYSAKIGNYYLGNGKFAGETDTGEPFIITKMDGMSGVFECGIGIEEQSDGKELRISGSITTIVDIKQIDEEFIPDTIARLKDISYDYNLLENTPDSDIMKTIISEHYISIAADSSKIIENSYIKDFLQPNYYLAVSLNNVLKLFNISDSSNIWGNAYLYKNNLIDSGEDFCVVEEVNEMNGMQTVTLYSRVDFSGTFKVLSIINEKYIPDTIARTDHTHETVTNADHSSTADTATEAIHAKTSSVATKATQDGNGNVIADTYALKEHEHSWDELNDRPFGEEMEIKDWICIPESTVEVSTYTREDGSIVGSLEIINSDKNLTSCSFYEGIYLIKINGENYTILESITSDDNWLYNYGYGYYIGNPHLYKQQEIDNGEHLFMGCIYTESSGVGGIEIHVDDTLAELGTFTLEVIPLKSYAVEQLDEKYIPDTISRTNHTHNWNEFGELPENILVYEEQSLAEEQQMQARKNLGLYYKSARCIHLLDSMEIATHTEKELPSDILLNDDITVCITQEDTVSVEYTLEQKEEYDYGSDIIFRWYGNGALVNSSLSDTEEGMVIYRENEGSWRMYIDYSKIESANRYSNFYVDIIDPNNTETVYEPIPEEFIPETIARVDYVDESISSSINDSLPIVPIEEIINYDATITSTEAEKYIETNVYLSSAFNTPNKIFVCKTRDNNKQNITRFYYRSDSGVDTLITSSWDSTAALKYEYYVFSTNGVDGAIPTNYSSKPRYHDISIIDLNTNTEKIIRVDWTTTEFIKTLSYEGIFKNEAIYFINKESKDKSYSPAVDTDLATKAYVDSIIPTQEEALALVAELGFVEPVANNGYVLTDGDNVIYTI